MLEHRLADFGDKCRDIIITDALDTIPYGSTIDTRVDTVGAKDMEMRIEIAGRAPALGERNASRLWIFESKGESFLAAVEVNMLRHDPVDLAE